MKLRDIFVGTVVSAAFIACTGSNEGGATNSRIVDANLLHTSSKAIVSNKSDQSPTGAESKKMKGHQLVNISSENIDFSKWDLSKYTKMDGSTAKASFTNMMKKLKASGASDMGARTLSRGVFTERDQDGNSTCSAVFEDTAITLVNTANLQQNISVHKTVEIINSNDDCFSKLDEVRYIFEESQSFGHTDEEEIHKQVEELIAEGTDFFVIREGVYVMHNTELTLIIAEGPNGLHIDGILYENNDHGIQLISQIPLVAMTPKEIEAAYNGKTMGRMIEVPCEGISSEDEFCHSTDENTPTIVFDLSQYSN